MTSLFTLKFLGWLLSVMVSVMLGKGAVEKIIGSRESVGNFGTIIASIYFSTELFILSISII